MEGEGTHGTALPKESMEVKGYNLLYKHNHKHTHKQHGGSTRTKFSSRPFKIKKKKELSSHPIAYCGRRFPCPSLTCWKDQTASCIHRMRANRLFIFSFGLDVNTQFHYHVKKANPVMMIMMRWSWRTILWLAGCDVGSWGPNWHGREDRVCSLDHVRSILWLWKEGRL